MSLFTIFGALLAHASAVAAEPSLPGSVEIRSAADRCGVPAPVLGVTGDESGALVEIDPGDDDSPLLARQIACFVAWTEENAVRIGFQAEPNGTQPVATGYGAGILDLRQASRICGLPARVSARPGDLYTLVVHRPAAADGLECLLEFLDENRTRLQLDPPASTN